MVLGLRQFTERVGDGAGEPVLDADNGEEIMHVQPGVAVVLGNRAPESPGTLYISTKYSLSLSLSLWNMLSCRYTVVAYSNHYFPSVSVLRHERKK